MAKKINQVKTEKLIRRRQFYAVAIPLIALTIKLIIMSNVKAGAWLGADGENYLKGVEGLQAQGFFSDEPKLSYWPAGYPIMMWPFSEITTVYFFYIISFIQSIFFAFATYFFAKESLRTKFANFTLISILFISFNPTLSLATLAIGYEAPVAACFLMVAALTVRHITFDFKNETKKILNFAQIAFWFSVIIFMQPRFIAVAIFFILLVCFWSKSKKYQTKILLLGILITLLSPALLIARNYEVSGKAVISNNLGVTMAIGAGSETTGSYVHSGPEIPCDFKASDGSVSDNQKVKCVLVWYAKNPGQSIRLAYNKTKFFWSPWSGPLADGTMARNPWLKIAPAYTVTKNQDGSKLVLGGFGQFISYLWIIGQIISLFGGFWILFRNCGIERNFSILLISPVFISWLISLGTIGDHRFRVPTMSISLILQAIAFQALAKKISKVV